MKLQQRIYVKLLLLVLVFCMCLIPSKYTFATSKEVYISVIGEGSINVKADSAIIYGSIECVDLDNTIANDKVVILANKINEYILSLNDPNISFIYHQSHPIEPICYRTTAYIAYVSYQINCNDISSIQDICLYIDNITDTKIHGVEYYTDNTLSYTDALKQAIAKANIKATTIYGNNLLLAEIEEQDCYCANSAYLDYSSIDWSATPQIEIKAKAKVIYTSC